MKVNIAAVGLGHPFEVGFNEADALLNTTVETLTAEGITCTNVNVVMHDLETVLRRHGIAASQDKLVKNIINRAGTGICPFEEAVLTIHTPEEALTAIRGKMKEMNISL